MINNDFHTTFTLAYNIYRSALIDDMKSLKVLDLDLFDIKLIHKMNEKLKSSFYASNKQSYIDMFEEIYNTSLICRKNYGVYQGLRSMIDIVKKASFSDYIPCSDEPFDAGLSQRDYDEAFDILKTFLNSEGVELSEWIVVDGYCATRTLLGHENDDDPEYRYAFIEKTPRIRIAGYQDFWTEQKSWFSGSKGCGGENGHIPENELYGFYPASRKWCDEILTKLGYVLN